MDASVLASAALALAWSSDKVQAAEDPAAARPTHGGLAAGVKHAAWRGVFHVRTLNQVLPACCVALAAVSPWSILSTACSFGFSESGLSGTDTRPGVTWLGEAELTAWRRLLLLTALAVWRAEKLESLLQRMQRSVDHVRSSGLGPSLSSAAKDPWLWVWPAFWGIVRRLGLVAISSFGYMPFLLLAFPSVVLDECLWWLVATVQDLWARRVCSLPAAVDVIVLPLLDLLHFLPVMSRVLLLAVIHYPTHDTANAWLLAACALAWTGHNCHTFYSTAFRDLPENAQQLLAARAVG